MPSEYFGLLLRVKDNKLEAVRDWFVRGINGTARPACADCAYLRERDVQCPFLNMRFLAAVALVSNRRYNAFFHLLAPNQRVVETFLERCLWESDDVKNLIDGLWVVTGSTMDPIPWKEVGSLHWPRKQPEGRSRPLRAALFSDESFTDSIRPINENKPERRRSLLFKTKNDEVNVRFTLDNERQKQE